MVSAPPPRRAPEPAGAARRVPKATMAPASLRLSIEAVRRLAIYKQRLAGPSLPATTDGIHDLVQELGCLQLDPISVVARSHLLVLWSRLGPYDPTLLERLLWQERRLFEYWAHCAAIVPVEDYPLHQPMMRAYVSDATASGRQRVQWLEEHRALHDYVLDTLAERGPLPSRAFTDRSSAPWVSNGWASDHMTGHLLQVLWLSGRITVAGRQGGQKLWHLSEHVLPDWTPRDQLSPEEVTLRAVERSVRALGTARPADIRNHFLRGRYTDLPAALRTLVQQGRLLPVEVTGSSGTLKGPWYLHAEDEGLTAAIATSGWQPRTSLLSPFDNLICDRSRTAALFDFDFRIGIYTPKAKRQWGYYSMPVLHEDRILGFIDPAFDRKSKRLRVLELALHPEDGASAPAVAASVEALARFLGATDIAWEGEVPSGWKALKRT